MAEDMETKISEFEDDNEFASSSSQQLVLDVDGFAGIFGPPVWHDFQVAPGGRSHAVHLLH